ncbi:MAG: protein translocase subunit SecD [Candidatus Magasanikbacteria bacterium]|nr:protein translocase subunit SecD [Candidatus Magasanikbacteria bacterium]
MAKNMKPTVILTRSQVKWRVGWIAILLVVCALVVAPTYANRGIDWVNNKTNFGVPRLPENGFNLGLDLQGGAHLVYQTDTRQVPDADKADSVEGVRDVIERRVRGGLGVAEPLVQTTKVGNDYRIIVELPGVTDVNTAIKMIGETPVLEFKEQNDQPPRDLTKDEQKQLDDYNAKATVKANDALKEVKKGTSFATVVGSYTEDTAGKNNGGDLGFINSKIYPEIYTWAKAHKDGEFSTTLVKSFDGLNIVKRIAERLVPATVDASSTIEYQVARVFVKTKQKIDIVPPTDQWKTTGLSGKQLKRAEVTQDSRTGQTQVNLNFDDAGTKLFADITGRNVGKPVAIFLDGQPISVPKVNEPILSGSAVISGGFTLVQAKQLSQRLNSGALPVPVELISQQKVDATLGSDSLTKSFHAGLVGLLGVMIFMIVYYRFPGLLSVFSLVVYALLSLATFKLVGVTLTLSGIAGFILSIGMAVDTNVLVFERLKEELRSGKNLHSASEESFRRSWPSIRDGHIATLVSCVFLVWFGTGFVQGFAVTLAIGVLFSLFTAIVATRAMSRLVFKWFNEEGNMLFLGHTKRNENNK